jgi:ABC-type multidrug transport system fused ATPase/permease subunit
MSTPEYVPNLSRGTRVRLMRNHPKNGQLCTVIGPLPNPSKRPENQWYDVRFADYLWAASSNGISCQCQQIRTGRRHEDGLKGTSMSSEEKILEVEHLFVTLDSRQIRRDISFSLKKGEALAIVGQMEPVRLCYSEHC